MATHRRRKIATPRQKIWYALETPEGRFIRFAEMCKTVAEKQNNFYRKHKSGYQWRLYSAHIHDIEIRSLVA